MVLLSPQPAVRDVLSLSGFDQLMPVCNSNALVPLKGKPETGHQMLPPSLLVFFS